jgi:NAD dependent epimerase/dehydratase family enzyme
VAWDAETVGDWAGEIDGADVVINLAGRSVNCRYTPRTAGDRGLAREIDHRGGEGDREAKRPPRVWLQASTATVYAHRYDAPNDEATGILGGDEPGAPETWRFSIDVVKAWERAAEEARTPQTRKILMRSAMVMSPDRGGIFDTLLRLVRFGLGGTAADGRQYISWIHDDDFVRAVFWLIEREDVDGPVNLAAPSRRPTLPSCASCARPGARASACPPPRGCWLGAIASRTETELVLKSRRVVPRPREGRLFRFRCGRPRRTVPPLPAQHPRTGVRPAERARPEPEVAPRDRIGSGVAFASARMAPQTAGVGEVVDPPSGLRIRSGQRHIKTSIDDEDQQQIQPPRPVATVRVFLFSRMLPAVTRRVAPVT